MSPLAELGSRLRRELHRLRLSVELLLERRVLAVALVDGVILLMALVTALVTNGEPASIYQGVVVLPFVVLGVPILANAVALERRSGSLELVLASPTGRGYLLRRYASFCALLTLQGWIIMLAAWFIPSRPFPLPFVLLQILLACALLGAISFFWGMYLKSSGAVILTTAATLAVFSRWFLASPIPEEPTSRLLLTAEELTPWAKTNLVLACAAVIFYLYARRRSTRTESLLS